MKKTILTFGLISGAISSLMMVASVPVANRIGFDKGVVIGYTSIVLSFCWYSSASGHTATTSAAARLHS